MAFAEIAEAFEAEYPGVRVLRESAGSTIAARKITDLHRACDVFVSADYRIIDERLMPEYADWSLQFARNELCLAYHARSTLAEDVGPETWPAILRDERVTVARCDADTAPCGYRTLQALHLAEAHYDLPGLAADLEEKGRAYLRPKEPDIVPLLETGAVDYGFIYRSTAERHGFPYVALPPEINLGVPALAEAYAAIVVSVTGPRPGSTVAERARPIVYGLTILKDAPNRAAAEAFVAFLLDEAGGVPILERHHQSVIAPSIAEAYDRVPESLRTFVSPASHHEASRQP